MIPELIFCGGKNENYAKIAIENGYRYGAQLPCVTHGNLYFADQNWKKPNRKSYMDALETHRPFMASVIDFERVEQRDEVLSWAEEASSFVDVVMIIPKVNGEISKLPRKIGKSSIRLGYSIPTKHGGTEVPISEFENWPVHLLGGNPGKQMELFFQMNVVSADGNMSMKMANRGLFWVPGKNPFKNKWVSLLQADGARWIGNGNHEAFRRSCVNIMSKWKEVMIMK